MNNLYIVNEVLSDYTPGMVVIAAANLADARTVFESEWDDDCFLEEFDSAIADAAYKVIENVDYKRGVVSYVFGGV